MTLAELAPRLARARDAWLAWDRERDQRRRWLQSERLRLERLVAHRELQEMRAVAACGKARSTSAQRSAGIYLVRRQRKLEEAEKALARIAVKLVLLERAR